MDIGPEEIIIIILLVVVLFGIAWAVKNKRLIKRPGSGSAPSNRDNSQPQ